MKKRKASKLSLSRETLRSLEDSRLGKAEGAAAAVAVAKGSFLNPCTNVVSDCYACTGRLDTCPDPTVVAV
ncbi:MAG TPA: hypothetical protein VIA62_16950 [Thermoanaerobaculia bacterium]|jgi:hypothetical protein|nr:hypothetical protein [Thermoanaerobaculia bacterium]